MCVYMCVYLCELACHSKCGGHRTTSDIRPSLGPEIQGLNLSCGVSLVNAFSHLIGPTFLLLYYISFLRFVSSAAAVSQGVVHAR